jgi:hypothetical protein
MNEYTLQVPYHAPSAAAQSEPSEPVGARRHVTSIAEIARELRPDVLVRDEVDLGTAIVAELLAIPCATVSVLAAGGFLRKELVAQPLNELRTDATWSSPTAARAASSERRPTACPWSWPR